MGQFFNEAFSTVGFGPTSKMKTNPDKLDPKYTSLVSNMNKSARDYRANIPGMQQNKTNIARDTSRLDLARSYVDADRAANNRGMFYGGKRAGMRVEAESQNASDLANKIRGINLNLEDTAQGMEESGIEAAAGMQKDQQALYDQAYNEALSKREAEQKKKSGFHNQLGVMGGGMIGNFLGSKGGGSSGGGGAGGLMGGFGG